MHTYTITYEDYRGEVFEDYFETDVDTVEEAEELWLDDREDVHVLSVEKMD